MEYENEALPNSHKNLESAEFINKKRGKPTLHSMITNHVLEMSVTLKFQPVRFENCSGGSDAYSWSCYWLDQFLTPALDAWILSKFSTLYWICLLLTVLILVGAKFHWASFSGSCNLYCFLLFVKEHVQLRLLTHVGFFR